MHDAQSTARCGNQMALTSKRKWEQWEDIVKKKELGYLHMKTYADQSFQRRWALFGHSFVVGAGLCGCVLTIICQRNPSKDVPVVAPITGNRSIRSHGRFWRRLEHLGWRYKSRCTCRHHLQWMPKVSFICVTIFEQNFKLISTNCNSLGPKWRRLQLEWSLLRQEMFLRWRGLLRSSLWTSLSMPNTKRWAPSAVILFSVLGMPTDFCSFRQNNESWSVLYRRDCKHVFQYGRPVYTLQFTDSIHMVDNLVYSGARWFGIMFRGGKNMAIEEIEQR